MNEDGRMARLNDLFKFSKKHKIKLASIEDLISYRFKNEKLVYKSASKSLSISRIGKLNLHVYKNKLEKNIKTSVPQFIAVNDKIVISTIDGSYIEKSKN